MSFLLFAAVSAGGAAFAAPAPPAPAGLHASISKTQVTLVWEPVAGASVYFPYVSEDGVSFDLASSEAVSTCSYPIGHLTEGRTYTFYVTALVSGVEGPPSARVAAVPGAESSAAPASGAAPPPVAAARPRPTAETSAERPAPADRNAAPRRLVRATRRFAIVHEFEWNGLAGFGPVFSYHVTPNVSADAGAGISGVGWKTGVRARWNFLRRAWTPYLGAGYTYGTGSGGVLNLTDANNANPIDVVVTGSHFLLVAVGVEGTLDGGFTFRADLGRAALLSPNVRIVNGVPTDDERASLQGAYGSGPIFGFSIGWTIGQRP